MPDGRAWASWLLSEPLSRGRAAAMSRWPWIRPFPCDDSGTKAVSSPTGSGTSSESATSRAKRCESSCEVVFSQQPRDGFFHWSTCRNASLPTIASRAVAFLPLEVSGTRKVAATCSSSREYRPRIELISSPVGLRVTSLNRLSCWTRSCSVCICLASGPEAVVPVLPEALGEDDFALLGSPLEPQPVAARTRSAQAAASRIFTGGMREDATCARQEDAERITRSRDAPEASALTRRSAPPLLDLFAFRGCRAPPARARSPRTAP